MPLTTSLFARNIRDRLPAWLISLVNFEAAGARSFHAIAGEFGGNVGIDRLRSCNIGTPAAVALLQPRHAAAVERARELRVDIERVAIVGYGAVQLAESQIGKAAGVDKVRIILSQAPRLLPIRPRRLPLNRPCTPTTTG